MARLIKIAETQDLPPGQGGLFDVEGNRIAVFNVDGRFYAVEDTFNCEEQPPPGLARSARLYQVRAAGNEIQLEL